MATNQDTTNTTSTSGHSPNFAIRRLDGNLGVNSLDGHITMQEYQKGKALVSDENRNNLKAVINAIKKVYSDSPEVAKQQIQSRIKIEEAPLTAIYEKNKHLPDGSKVDISALGFNVDVTSGGIKQHLSQQLTADIAVVREMLGQFQKNASAALEKEFPSTAPSTPQHGGGKATPKR